MGNLHPNITPYETFPTVDAEIAVAVGSERQWQRFCAAIERPALADDPRFADNAARLAHRDDSGPSDRPEPCPPTDIAPANVSFS